MAFPASTLTFAFTFPTSLAYPNPFLSTSSRYIPRHQSNSSPGVLLSDNRAALNANRLFCGPKTPMLSCKQYGIERIMLVAFSRRPLSPCWMSIWRAACSNAAKLRGSSLRRLHAFKERIEAQMIAIVLLSANLQPQKVVMVLATRRSGNENGRILLNAATV